MKRILAVLLTLSMLLLCGCETSNNSLSDSHNTSDQEQATPTTEATLPPIDSYSEETGLVIDVAMGPEFTLELSLFHTVLSATPKNEEAETLLSNLELEEMHYYYAIPKILDAAKENGFLNSITLTVSENTEDSWNVASHNILAKPVKDYMKNNAASFTWELIPAGRVWDVDGYTDTHTNKYDDHTETICYNYGMHEMTYRVYTDGTYAESYYTSLEEGIFCEYHPDGTFAYNLSQSDYYISYTASPDGMMLYSTGMYDSNHNLIQSSEILSDGTKIEAFYENGMIKRIIHHNADGTITEEHFDSNGSISSGEPVAAPEEGIAPAGTVPAEGIAPVGTVPAE